MPRSARAWVGGSCCHVLGRGNARAAVVRGEADRFFATLKRELVGGEAFPDRAQARRAIFEWIEVFYNRQRRHSTLGYVSPAQFELQHAARAA